MFARGTAASEDKWIQWSRVTAVALAPVVFELGTDRLGQGMDPHLEKVADFMRGAPRHPLVEAADSPRVEFDLRS